MVGDIKGVPGAGGAIFNGNVRNLKVEVGDSGREVQGSGDELMVKLA